MSNVKTLVWILDFIVWKHDETKVIPRLHESVIRYTEQMNISSVSTTAAHLISH